MNIDLTPILNQIKTLYDQSLPLIRSIGNLIVWILNFIVNLISAGLGKL